MTPAADFGQRVKRLRKALTLSQGELARRAKLHRVSLARIEAGRSVPSLDTVERVARALRVKPGQLFEAEASEERKKRK